MGWMLTQVAPQLYTYDAPFCLGYTIIIDYLFLTYSMTPFDSIFSEDGRLVATDMNSVCFLCSQHSSLVVIDSNFLQTLNEQNPQFNQVALQVNEESLNQLWTFNTPA